MLRPRTRSPKAAPMTKVCPGASPGRRSQARGSSPTGRGGKTSPQARRGAPSPGATGSSVWRRHLRPSGSKVAPGRRLSRAGGKRSSMSARFVARGSKPRTMAPARTLKRDQSVPSKTPASTTRAPGLSPRTKEKGDTSGVPTCNAARRGEMTPGTGASHGGRCHGSVARGTARSPDCHMRCNWSSRPKSGHVDNPDCNARGLSSRAVVLARSSNAACRSLLCIEKYNIKERNPSTHSW
mmetsp:Transcript_62089/g.173373  ORF Transcript_62089/g.173373 Transcript_62089/m.173373 type:complete len:239 (-) Transcript_62089:285-1001(-)